MDVLATLKVEEMRLKSDLAKVQKAIAALNGAGGHGSNSAATKSTLARPKRKLSAAGRARIVAALKARWAKVKAAKKKTK
jgi:hypothetical protein